MLCKCHWIVLYTVHFTAFCSGGPFFPGHGVVCFCALCTVVLWYFSKTAQIMPVSILVSVIIFLV